MKYYLVLCGLALSFWGPAAITRSEDSNWQLDSDCQYDGHATVRSEAIGDNGSTQFSVVVEGVESFSFAWKVDSEADWDKLWCYLDGMLCAESISGQNGDWQEMTIPLCDSNSHTVKWEYTKDSSNSFGEDCGWVWFDGIEDVLSRGSSDDEDTANESTETTYPWTYSQPWVIRKNNTGPYTDGCFSLMSTERLAAGESTSLSLTVSGRRTFEFWWASSSASDDNRMIVAIDDVVQEGGVCGYSFPWAKRILELPDLAEHKITWTYETNVDTAWSDVGFLWFEEIREIAIRNCETSMFLPWEKGTGWNDGSLMSAKIDDAGGTSYLSFPVKGSSGESISYTVKVSSEEGHDYLNVYLDGVLQNQFSGEYVGCYSFTLEDSKQHIIRFEYSKDDNGLSAGEDRAWVCWDGDDDQLICGTSSVFVGFLAAMERLRSPSETEAKTVTIDMNTTRAVQRNILNGAEGVAYDSGTAWNCWKVGTSAGYDGEALCSGWISNQEESWMTATVIGAGTVTFHWKVSSEAEADLLSYYVDDELKGSISGEQDWSEVQVALADDAKHVIKWVYSKNESGSSGSDCGWIDGITWNAPLGYDDPDEPLIPASVSTFITLDLTPSPCVSYVSKLIQFKAPKTIVFSPDWSNASSVVLKVNGQILETATDSATYNWMPTAKGTYVFTLEQLDAEGKAVANPLTYTFEVYKAQGVFIGIY